MARTCTHLRLMGRTEEAFRFYQNVFRTELLPTMRRMRDVADRPGMPTLSEAEHDKIMHIELPIVGGHVLKGTDRVEELREPMVVGSQVSISVEPDTREEAERLFAALAVGGAIDMPLKEMFWGAIYGALSDRFGVRWIVTCTQAKR